MYTLDIIEICDLQQKIHISYNFINITYIKLYHAALYREYCIVSYQKFITYNIVIKIYLILIIIIYLNGVTSFVVLCYFKN